MSDRYQKRRKWRLEDLPDPVQNHPEPALIAGSPAGPLPGIKPAHPLGRLADGRRDTPVEAKEEESKRFPDLSVATVAQRSWAHLYSSQPELLQQHLAGSWSLCWGWWWQIAGPGFGTWPQLMLILCFCSLQQLAIVSSDTMSFCLQDASSRPAGLLVNMCLLCPSLPFGSKGIMGSVTEAFFPYFFVIKFDFYFDSLHLPLPSSGELLIYISVSDQ